MSTLSLRLHRAARQADVAEDWVLRRDQGEDRGRPQAPCTRQIRSAEVQEGAHSHDGELRASAVSRSNGVLHAYRRWNA